MKDIKRETASEDLLGVIIDRGLTQKQIAKGSGLTEQTISKIVSGKKPNILTTTKINRYLSGEK